VLTENQKRWGVDQWAAYLSSRELPCMPRSKARLLELERHRENAWLPAISPTSQPPTRFSACDSYAKPKIIAPNA
jgi:hypothetical protein